MFALPDSESYGTKLLHYSLIFLQKMVWYIALIFFDPSPNMVDMHVCDWELIGLVGLVTQNNFTQRFPKLYQISMIIIII